MDPGKPPEMLRLIGNLQETQIKAVWPVWAGLLNGSRALSCCARGRSGEMAAKCEASVTVMELPSKRVLSIDLPSEEGGDMITMEEFMSLVTDKLSGGLDLSYLIMGRRIYYSDHSRPVHFFLLDGSPCFAYTVAHQNTVVPQRAVNPIGPRKEIYVYTLTGEKKLINVPLGVPIVDVKFKTQDIEGRSAEADICRHADGRWS